MPKHSDDNHQHTTPIQRPQVLEFIQTQIPETATLPEIIERLCQLRLETMPPYDSEFLKEFGEELPYETLIRGERLPAVPTRQEVFQLISAPDNPRDRLLFRVLYASGIRIAEMCNLLFADVHYTERLLFIRSGKGDKDRYALIDPETELELQQWQADQPPTANVMPISERQAQRLFEKYAAQTGLADKYQAIGRKITPHSMRHAFATHCYENGMDLFALKKLLGHDYLDTTEMYIETSMNRWRDVYQAHHAFGRDPQILDHLQTDPANPPQT